MKHALLLAGALCDVLFSLLHVPVAGRLTVKIIVAQYKQPYSNETVNRFRIYRNEVAYFPLHTEHLKRFIAPVRFFLYSLYFSYFLLSFFLSLFYLFISFE